ncbi:hypothetical protein GYMLUDRAFT_247883 [Collybiopsis luxurians FD-317 M1]|uniref:Uncharacterized protein n=1 Tax=Collybiopsis luxurians FD-317 M1 TaxID=944289 RepID=A0A0D0CME3_9AGAR|nr:hypothetical protein GYMLUDRAFT_247883 [Collybiopsis luxurians FD-317 M1]
MVKAKTSTKISKDAAYYARNKARRCAEAREYMRVKRAAEAAPRTASQKPSPKDCDATNQISPASQTGDSGSASLTLFYNAFIMCRNDFDTWLDSSVPQEKNTYFHNWERYGAGISVRLYQLMSDIQDGTQSQLIYKGVCAMQMHLGRRRAERFFSVNARSLNQSIPRPSWGQLKYVDLTDNQTDHFNGIVSTLRNEADGIIEEWGGLGETRRYGKIRHMERTADSIEGLYVKWRELLDNEVLVGAKIDITTLAQEASHTLFVLGEILERVTFALSHKALYPLRRK